MHHYVISFHVIIDGKDIGTGLIGRVSPTTDYKPNLLKGTIIRHYRKKYPDSRVVTVHFLDTKDVSLTQYEDERENFIGIK